MCDAPRQASHFPLVRIECRDRGGGIRWFRNGGIAVTAGVKVVLIALIRCYQGMIRPHLAGTCKYCPHCSEYAIEALREHGAVRGSAIAMRRLMRCHPFSRGGIDPVPPRGT